MKTITTEKILATAGELNQDEFTRADLAGELNVKPRQLKDGVKAARESGRLEKVRDDNDGRGVFRLIGE